MKPARRGALPADIAPSSAWCCAEGSRSLIGIVIGIAVAYAAARGMSALLLGVRPEDPLPIAVAAGRIAYRQELDRRLPPKHAKRAGVYTSPAIP